MLNTKTKFSYKGYILQQVSQNIKVLYMPEHHKRRQVSYALSFDGGKTWNIGKNKKTYICCKSGSPQEMVDICLQINEDYDDEE